MQSSPQTPSLWSPAHQILEQTENITSLWGQRTYTKIPLYYLWSPLCQRQGYGKATTWKLWSGLHTTLKRKIRLHLLFLEELLQGDLVLGHELVPGRRPFHTHRVVRALAGTKNLVNAAQWLFGAGRFVTFSLTSYHIMCCVMSCVGVCSMVHIVRKGV